MIERVLIKEYLSFDKVDISLEKGLVCFSGASGAGKSVFMDALLALFGLKDIDAKLVEASLAVPLEGLEELGIDNEEINILRFTKDKKARYFINSQGVSKKNMSLICSCLVRYLSARDDEEFSSFSLINILDALIKASDKSYEKKLCEYKKTFENYLKTKDKLEKIREEERKIDELREFAKYEVSTIDEVSPTIGEDERLMEVKKSLSKKEKISQALQEANLIFESESKVSEFLSICSLDSGFFDESMNELRALMEEQSDKLEELENENIEELLERIEKISKLKQRFGSIEQTLEYKEKKLKELEHYENISFEKSSLEKDFSILDAKVKELGAWMSKKREKTLPKLSKLINKYLQNLYLNDANFTLSSCELDAQGCDHLEVKLNKVNIKKISSGELNRIRLAFIATKNEIESKNAQGVLILDEVDSNLSGKEAMSVANVLKDISLCYQVLAISHQPQLSSSSKQHFLVSKTDEKSSINLLDKQGRVEELSRMISGEEIKPEAKDFAKKLLEENGFK